MATNCPRSILPVSHPLLSSLQVRELAQHVIKGSFQCAPGTAGYQPCVLSVRQLSHLRPEGDSGHTDRLAPLLGEVNDVVLLEQNKIYTNRQPVMLCPLN